ncbi:protein MALE DISCOVERER 1-like isoform X1 [Andrographis paniculata]|uniref:protein MALE DISCOVERER 1-like isoform X1 n=1 Tax=Andrographis paniculata TaxID=175694 RepID=UPI0021E71443|nr:protein MALE DISCOVERER 1-like isoform X1 [Andrographis paniculata]
MVRLAMSGYGNRIHLFCFMFFIIVFEINGCCFLNSEGLALLQFRSMVDFDPSGTLEDWDPNDCNPCAWSGIECVDGDVVMLNLSGCDLEGALSPELANLTHLRFLDLSKNHLSGAIPPQFGHLAMLEVLDLRDNNLSGTVPAELGELHSLRRLLLCNNRFEGSLPVEIGKLSLLSDIQFDDVFSTAAAGICCVNRKFGHSRIWQSVLKQMKKSDSTKQTIANYLNLLPKLKGSESSDSHGHNCCSYLTDSPETDVIESAQEHVNNARRILAEDLANLVSLPPDINALVDDSPGSDEALPSRSSGSFPAVANPKPSPAPPVLAPSSSPPLEQENKTNGVADPSAVAQYKDSSADGNSANSRKFMIGILVAVLLLVGVIVLLLIFRKKATKNISPWKTGLSGQLQKAFVTGVPKLNRDELETACEDFSNIIYTREGVVTLYKGTLSSGVEIAVVSTAIESAKEWSKQAELLFRKKIETLSRVNHKNFVNLIGYCEESEPFTRMMVFEFAPNGSLSDYLQAKDLEDLGWDARIRIIMGTAYCLQYMHELNPPVAHLRLTTRDVFLTDDHAAKICDVAFWAEFVASSKNPAAHEPDHSEQPPLALETDVYSFGILMLEIISGKLPESKEGDNVLKWANQYLNDQTTLSELIDPALKSFKDSHLPVVCEAIQSCIDQNPRKRPAMKEVIEKLRQAIDVSPEAATPRLSPLWWAELEILSSEAA